MNESKKEEAQQRSGGLQRGEKEKLREKILSIRHGHTTGGYCDSETLKVEEKKLHKILSAELAEAKEKFGYSPDPKFKHANIRAIEVELYGLSWKPELVVKGEN